MQLNVWSVALGLALLAAASARAEIVKGVMSVTGGEMT